MKFSYGKCPPYFAYKYCQLPGMDFTNYSFKTYYFDRAAFPNVAIATDGIMPIVKEEKSIVDQDIVKGNEVYVRMAVQDKRQLFLDDVTIVAFGGEKNEVL